MKTPKEFDYDLWTTEEGKCMVRIKLTGEVTEVDREVMRFLRAEEKRLRRAMEESGDSEELLSDHLCDGGKQEEFWFTDLKDWTEDIQTDISEEALRQELTPLQLDLYENCIIGGMTLREYARRNHIDYRAAWRRKELIQKKAKKFLT